jgi:hypothetical protein
LEKEARLVLNELWAKVSAREKLIVYGSVAVVIGWIVGMILGTKSYGGTIAGISYGGSVNFYTSNNAGLFDILALLAGIAALVVVYLKVAPNMNVTWPMPVVQILLGLTAIAAACGILAALLQFTNGVGVGDDPILMWVADVLVIGGGGFAAYNAYLDYTAAKA